MNIAYFHGGDDVPTVRFRRAFYLKLREKGHLCRLYPSRPNRYEAWSCCGWRGSQWIKRAVRQTQVLELSLRPSDVTVLETGLFHTSDLSFERDLRAHSERFVYEIDDAVFLLFPEKIAGLAMIADHVIAGNDAIASWISDHNQSVSVIPTCLDEAEYSSKWEAKPKGLSKPDHQSPVILGWVGSAGNVVNLQQILSPLNRICQSKSIQLNLLSSAASRHAVGELVAQAKFPVNFIDLDRCNLTKELHLFDIGVMPLPDDEWSRYKCNAKVIQYMLCGIPSVVSKIGFNLTLIKHGLDGLLAEGVDSWVELCHWLIENEDARAEMGQAARRSALQRYTVQSQLRNYENALLG